MAQSGKPARRTPSRASGKAASSQASKKATTRAGQNAAAPAAATEPTPVAIPAVKRNTREPEPSASPAAATATPAPDAAASRKNDAAQSAPDSPRYVYEFKQPESFITHVLIEHDQTGRGRITFERRTDGEPLTDPFELSPSALQRIESLWNALHFLDADVSYQTVKQFPHLGTTRLEMTLGKRERSTEFNWTNDTNAADLAREYRRAADQSMLVFEIDVALENQVLELPKLLIRFERLLETNGLSDARQLVPLLRSLQGDERVPLIARNHAERLLKKLAK